MAVTEASIPRIAKESAAIYRKWQPLIERYHGGVPEALIAVRMDIESSGTMDMRVGNDTAVGVLSVTEAQEDRFTVPRGSRLTKEGNVFLAATRYNVETALFLKKYPGVAKNYFDAYVFGGQLISGIGTGAADYLLDRCPRGITYKQFADWVQMMGVAGRLPLKGGPWGTTKTGYQIPVATIIYRVRAFQYMSDAAKLMQSKYGVPNEASAPAIPPVPASLKSTFTVPKNVGAIQMLTGGEKPYQARPQDLAMFLPKGVRGGGAGLLVAAGALFAGAAAGGLAVWLGARS